MVASACVRGARQGRHPAHLTPATPSQSCRRPSPTNRRGCRPLEGRSASTPASSKDVGRATGGRVWARSSGSWVEPQAAAVSSKSLLIISYIPDCNSFLLRFAATGGCGKTKERWEGSATAYACPREHPLVRTRSWYPQATITASIVLPRRYRQHQRGLQRHH